MFTNPFRSIRGKLTLAFLLFVIVPTLLIFWNYTRASKEVIAREVYAANQALADHSAQTANDTATRMIKALSLLESDFQINYEGDLTNWITDYSNYVKVSNLQRRMTAIRDLMLDDSAFIIFRDDRELAISTLYSFDMQRNFALLEQEPWYQAAKQNRGFPKWVLPYRLPPQIGNTGTGNNGGYIGLARSLHNAHVTFDYGVALIGVPIESIFGRSAEHGEGAIPSLLLWDGGDSITDSEGILVKTLSEAERDELRKAPGEIKRFSDSGEWYMANVANVTEMGISVIKLVPEEQFLKQLEKKMSLSIVSIALVFMIGILIFVLFLIRFTKPIFAMLRSMNQVGSGYFHTSVQVKGNDEIALLGNNFNRMVVRLRELMARLDDEQKQKEEAHFQSLQAQINPHFLFNTLNSIKLMAMLSNTNRNVSDMITALGKLLEFSMKMNQRFVTLGQEIEYLELYMSLQKIRYHDQIDIDIQVPPELREMYVLKFSLQPLVENSMIHGGRLPLKLSIHAEAECDLLRVVIRDNGIGVTEEQLYDIQDQLVHSHAKYSGIGISNVDRRIKLNFGSAYGIALGRIEDGGLEATVKFPKRREPPQ